MDVDIRAGRSAAFAGLTRALDAVADAGADFGALPRRYPAEWGVLRPPRADGASPPPLAAVALSASERRLHRECERTFRVLAVAAMALCRASESLDATLFLRGAALTDLVSLRGLIRAVEFSRATGLGRLRVEPPTAWEAAEFPEADYRAERARCLRLIGLDADPARLPSLPPRPHPRPGGAAAREEDLLFAAALDTALGPVARVSAAMSYCRLAFYVSNWEGMAAAAAACLPAAERLSGHEVAAVAAEVADRHPAGGENQAIEFEPAILRTAADARAFLLKALGIQATFRGRQDDAVRRFRAMRETEAPLSPELRAQSHLYTALTLTKRHSDLRGAAAEVDAGLEALRPAPREADSIRRERGWLHNLKALTLFSGKDMAGALAHEKRALGCLDGLDDASSVHLRVNLVSNISVLQERAGKPEKALETWERFSRGPGTDDPKFLKHHAYRAGGLRLRCGDREGAGQELGTSLRHCAGLADDFHESEVALELGALLLEAGRGGQAAERFAQAADATERLGDPYRMALARTALALAGGGRPGKEVARLARASRTHAARAGTLAEAVECAAPAGELRALLPAARTKLNRPFDLVNF
ncbi:hypothetical protein [Streptomyces hoynatensis]|uniref:hypothetical protein n=1 Tax=Streptomyces hoynatensis TaxID=1141874 RepID=UPI0019D4AED3|nr:hypothetical protein [Streptomyces hoynatensis]